MLIFQGVMHHQWIKRDRIINDYLTSWESKSIWVGQISTEPSGWWFFTKPSEKYAQVKLDCFPKVRGESKKISNTIYEHLEGECWFVFVPPVFCNMLKSNWIIFSTKKELKMFQTPTLQWWMLRKTWFDPSLQKNRKLFHGCIIFTGNRSIDYN